MPVAPTPPPLARERNAKRAVGARCGAALFGFTVAMLTVGPEVSLGCAASFSPQNRVEGLRILAVVADKPYAAPGDEVQFSLTYADGRRDPETGAEARRPVEITWMADCVNPPGDQYFACFDRFAALSAAGKAEPGVFARGDRLTTFTTTLPADIVTARDGPRFGPRYGLAYVYFAACAGETRFVEPTGEGVAGDFPLGCFDDEGNPIGAEGFVVGYTQIFVFDDGRKNQNPELVALTLDGDDLDDAEGTPKTVPRCGVSEEDRRVQGCGSADPAEECELPELSVRVGEAVSEVDPGGSLASGRPVREAVWVSYFVTGGQLDADVKLIGDAEGNASAEEDRRVKWTPPSEPGDYEVVAVLRDSRGGSSVLRRAIRVE